MIQPQKDPLRFLKPRKKNFHLTPPKNINKDVNNTFSTINDNENKLSNSNVVNPLVYTTMQKSPSNTQQMKVLQTQSRQELENRNKKQQIISNSQEFNFVRKTTTKIQIKGKKENEPCNKIQKRKSYQAYKYFSRSINQFLIKSKGSQGQTQQLQRKQKINHTAKDDSFNFESQLDHNMMIPLNLRDVEHQQINQTTMRVEDYFQQSSKAVLNSNRSNHIRQTPNEDHDDIRQNIFKVKNQNASNPRQGSNILGSDNYQGNIQNESIMKTQQYQYTGLKQCQTCGRSFNLVSFEKHSKVCQKVFFKKRKQFSSQKQRSKSRNK